MKTTRRITRAIPRHSLCITYRALYIVLAAAVSTAFGKTDATWGEAWNSRIGKNNYAVTGNSYWGKELTPGSRGHNTCLFDNSTGANNDYLTQRFPAWTRLVITNAFEEGKDIILKKYIIQAGSTSGRQPKDWKLYGSNDPDVGYTDTANMILIDERSAVLQSNYASNSYTVDLSLNQYSFRTYVLVIEHDNGANFTQILELWLFGEIKDHEETIRYTVSNGYNALYDGYPHTIAVTPTYPQGVIVQYAMSPEGPWGATAPSVKDVGEYEIWYSLEADGFPAVTNSVPIIILEPPRDNLDIMATIRSAQLIFGTTYATNNVTGAFATGTTFVNGALGDRAGWVNGGTLTYCVLDTYRPGDAIVATGVVFVAGTGSNVASNDNVCVLPRVWSLEARQKEADAWRTLASYAAGEYPAWTPDDIGTDRYYRRTTPFKNRHDYRQYRFTFAGGRTHVGEIALIGSIGSRKNGTTIIMVR